MKFFLKPIFWNELEYEKPSGFPAKSGYPAEHGYGHEEWNNSRRLQFERGGVSYRAFHTEGVGDPAAWGSDQIVLIMYASHHGVQQLIGVAADPRCLSDKEKERKTLGTRLNIESFWEDAWSVKSVRAAYEEDQTRFLDDWRRNYVWMPNWICRSDMYFQPEKPITLDPKHIRGKTKLLTMFGRHTAVDAATALRVMNSVPRKKRTETWSRVTDFIRQGKEKGRAEEQDQPSARDQEDTRDHELYDDLREIGARRNIDSTTRRALVDARLGQGRFRSAVEKSWGSECAVSGCSQRELLRASHMKPWRGSSDQERLDPANGLLLSANLDALFDRGLISFDDNGSMIVSRGVSGATAKFLGIPRSLSRLLTDKERGFLRHHREVVFRVDAAPP